MRTINYDATRLVWKSLGCLVVLPGFGLAAMFTGGFGPLIGAVLLIGGPAAAFGMLRRLFSDSTAIRYDRNQVTIGTMWSTKTVAWRAVASIDIVVRTTRAYGFIPINRTYFIEFEVVGTTIGADKLRIPLALIGLGRDAGVQLLADLCEAKLRAPVAPVSAQRPLGGPAGRGDPAPQAYASDDGANADFDPDAIIARYIADRDAPQAEPAQPRPAVARAAGFGRRGL